MRDNIFANVSQRVAAEIREEMKLTAVVKMSKVQEVRARLMRAVRSLHAGGDISWPPTATSLVEPSPLPSRPPQRRRPRPKQENRVRRYVIGFIATLGAIEFLFMLSRLGGKPGSRTTGSNRAHPANRLPAEKKLPVPALLNKLPNPKLMKAPRKHLRKNPKHRHQAPRQVFQAPRDRYTWYPEIPINRPRMPNQGPATRLRQVQMDRRSWIWVVDRRKLR